MTEKKTAEEILHEHIDKESMDELSVNVWPDMLEAMEAYAAQQSKIKLPNPSIEEIERMAVDNFSSTPEPEVYPWLSAQQSGHADSAE